MPLCRVGLDLWFFRICWCWNPKDRQMIGRETQGGLLGLIQQLKQKQKWEAEKIKAILHIKSDPKNQLKLPPQIFDALSKAKSETY